MEPAGSGFVNNERGSIQYDADEENIDDLDFDDLNGIPKDEEDRAAMGIDEDMAFDYDTDSEDGEFISGDLIIDEEAGIGNDNEDDDDDCEIIETIKTPSPTLNSTLYTTANTTFANGIPNKKIIIIYKMKNPNNNNSNVIDNGKNLRKQNLNEGIINPDLPLPPLPPPKPKLPSQKHIDFMKKYSDVFKEPSDEELQLPDADDETAEDQQNRHEERARQREIFLAEKEEEIVRNLTKNSGVKRVRCNQCFEMFYGPNSESALRAHIFQDHFDNKVRQFESFAETFKRKRIKLGYTQGDVGQALGKLYGSDFSQTTISRFEALNLSFNNMSKIEPILRKWLETAEAAANGDSSDFKSSSIWPDIMKKKRKKRTSIEQYAYDTLEKVFIQNQKLTSEEISLLADNLDMEKEVVRVWFCNRRQKEKRLNPEGDVTPISQGETVASILGQTIPRKRKRSPGPPHLEPMVPFPFPPTRATYAAKVPSTTSTSTSSNNNVPSTSTRNTAPPTLTTAKKVTSAPVTRTSGKLYAITKPPNIIKSPIKSKEAVESPKDNKENASASATVPKLSLVKTEPEENTDFRIDSIYSNAFSDQENSEYPAAPQSPKPQLQVYSNKRKRLS